MLATSAPFSSLLLGLQVTWLLFWILGIAGDPVQGKGVFASLHTAVRIPYCRWLGGYKRLDRRDGGKVRSSGCGGMSEYGLLRLPFLVSLAGAAP